jgi:hypothetical protein
MAPIPTDFLVFELTIYLLALVCLRHAWRQDRYRGLTIVTAAIFCFAAESLVIRITGEYYYNRFLVMLCLGGGPGGWGVGVSCSTASTCVPLAVPVMESLIVYAAMLTSDRLRLPLAVRSLFDGLLVLSIDFGMDPIVSRSIVCPQGFELFNQNTGVGMWVWKLNSTVEYVVGIDLNNYAGWFLGIAAFSLTQRLLRRRWPPERLNLPRLVGLAILSLPASMLLFAPLVFGYKFLVERTPIPEWVTFTTLIGLSLFFTYRHAHGVDRSSQLDPIPLLVPLFLYAYSLVALVAGQYYLGRPMLVAYWLAALALCAMAFTWPSWDRLAARGAKPDIRAV